MANENEPKGWIDNFFDKADEIVGGVERFAKAGEGVWKVEEIADAQSGEWAWYVSDTRVPKIQVNSKELAERIASLLNG